MTNEAMVPNGSKRFGDRNPQQLKMSSTQSSTQDIIYKGY
ncbi:hypothetical protein OOU_Y34scaffold00405g9 [Pyricularia oryzae Y34]|uniref:Uncharacterized protein n=2 Tax=Pyricularia oryzae TaxID=318829 RepID=A0AA97P2A4_PYRO3|nr:hypothetical protein OOU_Y34scaffold00405g9 [Pyricularia oryzae Y34]